MPPVSDPQVRVPTRILWGENDDILCAEEARPRLQYCPGGDLTYFPGATHWVQHEEPELVNRLLIEWFNNS